MPITFDPDVRYRMPVFFGPSTSPRQDADGKPFDWSQAPRTVASFSFLTEASHLEVLLPPGFSLDGEPVVTVEHYMLRELPWLAGRGYDALGVRFSVRFKGQRDEARGPLLTVMWENLTDAILTGREELGYSKIFADLPPPTLRDKGRSYTASWMGHQFMRLDLDNLEEAAPSAPAPVDGWLHYRYLPAVNDTTRSDVACVTLTPAGGPTKTERFFRGEGSVEFIQSSWEQLPTQHRVVNTFAAMPILESRGATLAMQRGAKDLSDVRVLF